MVLLPMMREKEETLNKRAISILINMQYYFAVLLYQFLMCSSAWNFIIHNVKKQGSLLVTVPSLQDSLVGREINIQLSSWVEEIPLNFDVYAQRDIDQEALQQIHLYKVL